MQSMHELNSGEGFVDLSRTMERLGYPDPTKTSILQQLEEVGFSDSSELGQLAQDFIERPEVFSALLQSDFGMKPLLAHKTRAAVMDMIRTGSSQTPVPQTQDSSNRQEAANVEVPTEEMDPSNLPSVSSEDLAQKKAIFKAVFVNKPAKTRESDDYGLPSNYEDLFPLLAQELASFNSFMTRPSATSQDPAIRPATASVYMRHAKLFLGWWTSTHRDRERSDRVSIYSIIVSKEKESASVFYDFVLWLRSSRNISVSYEANLLRGLTKLLKFRFAKESQCDPAYGGKSFDDIPIIQELRKLHRDANKRQSVAPRSSDESRKWLPWSEFLGVIEALKAEVLTHVETYESKFEATNKEETKAAQALRRKTAIDFQKYLILALFACIPDRQRTIRELEIGTTFVKDEEQDVWVVRHGPDDYKTGKTYGERPPLVVSPHLGPAIDDFLTRWRPCLCPSSDRLFVQPRTGNPMSRDSIYQAVARSCYKHTGKKTNPHLLRDMVVTHVRESDASEKELEALALYMGHSIQMQRTSYDRRTLTKKVAPAVELLQSLNESDS